MKKYTRICKKCGKEISYGYKGNYLNALKLDTLCQSCSRRKNEEIFVRDCPTCGCEIKYKRSADCRVAEKSSSSCKKCSNKKNARKRDYEGDNNPFHGKKHKKSSKIKIVESQKKKGYKKYRTKKFRNKMSKMTVGKNNGMHGKSVFDILVLKHGKEKAKKIIDDINKKKSEKMSGENNPMYGKPSPQGSGNGWSGWYNGTYFRSLRELSYIISELEKKNLEWESAEKKKYKIPYIDYLGKKRNYYTDFLIQGKKLVDIKPKKLWSSPSVLIKSIAAEKFCKKIGWKFELVDPKILSDKEILRLYNDGKIKFIKRYEEKFKRRYLC